jgi:hypothetical protein
VIGDADSESVWKMLPFVNIPTMNLHNHGASTIGRKYFIRDLYGMRNQGRFALVIHT